MNTLEQTESEKDIFSFTSPNSFSAIYYQCNFLNLKFKINRFIFSQYMMPTVYNSMKFVKDDNYIMMVERVMKLAIPNVYGWILMFYAFFHCWMNFLAELTRFSDRNFYKDWWNSHYLDQYWRTWNLVYFI
jgi:hypothetical protein